MNEKDKELVKSSGLVTVDAAVAGIDLSLGGLPLASGAWGLSKALFGAGLQLRQKKALEWIDMVKNSPQMLNIQLLESEEFQDAFVMSLESYIKERSDDKRIILRAIFRDYSSANNPKLYPLERLYEITKQITFNDARNFSLIYSISAEDKHMKKVEIGFEHSESVLHLVSLGLLTQDTSPRYVNDSGTIQNPRVFVSGLGRMYKTFIEDAESIKKPLFNN